MSSCLLFLLLATGCPSAPAPGLDVPGPRRLLGGPGAAASARPALADPWIAEDKVQHFAMSFAATGMAYGGGRLAMDPADARGVALGVGLVLGIGKELADVRRGERFSLKDLAWDAAGVALGFLFAQRMD